MSEHVRTLLHVVEPHADTVVAAVARCGAFQPAVRERPRRAVDRQRRMLATRRGARGLARRLVKGSAPALLRVPVATSMRGGALAPDLDDVGGLVAALVEPPVVLLPDAGHHLEQLHRAHVLHGGAETLEDWATPARARAMRAWREGLTAQAEAAGATVVDLTAGTAALAPGQASTTTPSTTTASTTTASTTTASTTTASTTAGRQTTPGPADDTATAALAEAVGAPADQAAAWRDRPVGISARGLEILRRLNGFLETDEERRAMREFCQATFPTGPDDPPSTITDEARQALLDRLAPA